MSTSTSGNAEGTLPTTGLLQLRDPGTSEKSVQRVRILSMPGNTVFIDLTRQKYGSHPICS